MAEPITITLQAGTVLLIAERAFAIFIAPRMRSKSEMAEHRSQTSGDKDPAYWEQKFGEVFDEKLDQRVLPILNKQSEILESVARTQEGIAALIRDSADSSKRRRR